MSYTEAHSPSLGMKQRMFKFQNQEHASKILSKYVLSVSEYLSNPCYGPNWRSKPEHSLRVLCNTATESV